MNISSHRLMMVAVIAALFILPGNAVHAENMTR